MRDDPEVIALVEGARAGDKAAWDQIVERFASLVWSICWRYRLTQAEVEDVSATVWLGLVEHLDTLRVPAALPGWLATTTQRECIRSLKAKERQIPVDDLESVDREAPAADSWLVVEERRVALRSAFAQLSGRCQRLLGLLFADPPATYTRISQETGMPVGAIGPTRQRCLERLREQPAIRALGEDPAWAERS